MMQVFSLCQTPWVRMQDLRDRLSSSPRPCHRQELRIRGRLDYRKLGPRKPLALKRSLLGSPRSTSGKEKFASQHQMEATRPWTGLWQLAIREGASL